MGNKIIEVKSTIYDFHTLGFLFWNVSPSINSLDQIYVLWLIPQMAGLSDNVKIIFLFLGKLWSKLGYSQHWKKKSFFNNFQKKKYQQAQLTCVVRQEVCKSPHQIKNYKKPDLELTS